jgi:hypothetical protein
MSSTNLRNGAWYLSLAPERAANEAFRMRNAAAALRLPRAFPAAAVREKAAADFEARAAAEQTRADKGFRLRAEYWEGRK